MYKTIIILCLLFVMMIPTKVASKEIREDSVESIVLHSSSDDNPFRVPKQPNMKADSAFGKLIINDKVYDIILAAIIVFWHID